LVLVQAERVYKPILNISLSRCTKVIEVRRRAGPSLGFTHQFQLVCLA